MTLINTRIQNIRSGSNLDKNELRPSRYGALDLFMQQTRQPGSIITPELEQAAERSIGSVLEVPVIDYDAGISIGNTRSVTIADSENTSQMFQLNFATYSWGFTIVPAMYWNNEIQIQKDFERKFLKYLYKFAEVLDGVAVASLSANKTQVFNDTLQYTPVGNVIQAPWELRENIIGDLNPIMAANDHFGQIHLLGNGGIESTILKLAQKALYNSEMKTLEFSDKILHFSTRVPNQAPDYGNMFAVQAASVGILKRFEREAVLGTSMADGTEWSTDMLPMLNMPVGTYFYESRGDFSGIAGAATADLTRAKKEHYGFSVDLAFLTPYNSDPATIASPIVQAAILSQV